MTRAVPKETVDSSRQYLHTASVPEWDEDSLAALKNRFVTGTWSADDDAAQVCTTFQTLFLTSTACCRFYFVFG